MTAGLIGQVIEAVWPARQGGHGSAWRALEAEHEQIRQRVADGVTVVKIDTKLEHQGVAVPYRTLHRFCVERCDFGRGGTTVRVADAKPGVELQIDFAQMGLLHDPARHGAAGVHALIFTAAYPRHMFAGGLGPGGS